jgi:hypothetical protein
VILDASESLIVSTLGWVDAGALWVCDTTRGAVRMVRLGEAAHLSLHPGHDDHVAVAHHFEGGRFELSVHRLAEPARPLARLALERGAAAFDGDADAWARVPRHYTAQVAREGRVGFALVRLDPRRRAVDVQRLAWYEDGPYDHLYQAIVGVAEVPYADLVIVSVQRDSAPVLYDPVARRPVGSIALAGRRGNPRCCFRAAAGELWADDYDTLLCLDGRTFRTRHARRLQPAAERTAQFVGAFAFDRSEALCAVARPFSGDVVALDTRTFELTHVAPLGRQPLEAALLADGRVFARDWMTGDLLTGRLTTVTAP